MLSFQEWCENKKILERHIFGDENPEKYMDIVKAWYKGYTWDYNRLRSIDDKTLKITFVGLNRDRCDDEDMEELCERIQYMDTTRELFEQCAEVQLKLPDEDVIVTLSGKDDTFYCSCGEKMEGNYDYCEHKHAVGVACDFDPDIMAYMSAIWCDGAINGEVKYSFIDILHKWEYEKLYNKEDIANDIRSTINKYANKNVLISCV